MLSENKKTEYLEYLFNILNSKERINIVLDRNWSKYFPDEPGVYVFFEKNKIVYTGETNSIKDRMRDILDSRHHTLKRKIGIFNFSDVEGFKKANSKTKFPLKIERLVNDWVIKKMKFSFLPVSLGRKELEDLIIKKCNPKYNSVTKRGHKKQIKFYED